MIHVSRIPSQLLAKDLRFTYEPYTFQTNFSNEIAFAFVSSQG